MGGGNVQWLCLFRDQILTAPLTVGTQNFNYAAVFFPNGWFSAPHCAYFDKHFPTKRFSDMFPTAQNLGGAIAPLLPCHDVTVT